MQYHAIAQLYSQDYCILFKIISFYNSIHFIFFLLNLFFLLIDIIVANNYCTNNYCIIVPYHYRSQFPDFITFLQNKNGLNSGCTSKIQHDWDKQWHDGYFSKEESRRPRNRASRSWETVLKNLSQWKSEKELWGGTCKISHWISEV